MDIPLKTFVVYSSTDRVFRDELELHLKPLVDSGLITLWSDKDIAPGDNWDILISENLQKTNIFIFLISIDFYNSIYISERELKTSIEKHKNGDAIIIPIIVRDCYWENFHYLNNLQMLPPEGLPISDKQWGSRDKAWSTCIRKINETIVKEKEKNKIHENILPKIQTNAINVNDDEKNIFLKFVEDKKNIIYDIIHKNCDKYEELRNSEDSYKNKVKKKIDLWYRISEHYKVEGYKRLDEIDLIVAESLKKISIRVRSRN